MLDGHLGLVLCACLTGLVNRQASLAVAALYTVAL
jgi:hypothetical protein